MKNIKEVLKASSEEKNLDNFSEMYYCLKEINDKEKQTKYKEDITQLIQLIIEYLIIADKKEDQTFFETFCELDYMNEFIVASKSKNIDILLQIIKSMSNLILTIKNKAAIFYIFSNNFINNIITNDDIQDSSEDFLSYYVNFLKSLSLKIDNTTLQLFFQKEKNSFPLLENALKLYNNEDSMIKNVIRNIFLKFAGLSTENKPLKEYLMSLPILKYFCFLSCRLVDMTIELNRIAGYEILYNYNNNKNFFFDYERLKGIHDDLIDEILYLNDILCINDSDISYVLLNSLLYYYICPLLLGSILNFKYLTSDDFKKKQKNIGYVVAPEIALYILTLFFSNIHNDSLLNILCILLFRKKINLKIIDQFVNVQFSDKKPPFLSNYSYNYKLHNYKEKNLTFAQYIAYNYNKKFICSLIMKKNSKFSEIVQLNKKYEKKFDDSSFDPYDNYENILNDVNSKLSTREKYYMKNYHHIISTATGIKSGLIEEEYEKCVLYHLNEEIDMRFMIQNPIRNIILEELFRSGYEIINLGINLLLYSMYYYIYLDDNKNMNNSLSRKLLYYECNLLPYDLFKKKEVINKNEIIEENKKEGGGDNIINDNNKIIKDNKENQENTNIIKNDEKNSLIFKTKNYELKYDDNKFIYNIDFFSDKKTINNLIQLINFSRPYCSLELLLIIYNIKFLISPIKNKEENIVDDDKENKDNIISQELLLNKDQKVNIVKAIIELIQKINVFLKSINNVKIAFFESFEQVWNTYKQDYAFNIKNLIIKYILTPYYICIPSSVINVEDFPFKNDNNKCVFDTLLLGYLALRDLLNNTISDKFPLENGNFEYKLGDKIILENININDQTFKLMKLMIKFDKKKELEESYLFLNKNCAILGKEENDEKIGKKVINIKKMHPLREMEVSLDKELPNVMQIFFKENNYIIECESNEKKIEIKSELEKQRNEFRKWEEDILVKFFDDDEKKYKSFLDNNNDVKDTSDDNNKK